MLRNEKIIRIEVQEFLTHSANVKKINIAYYEGRKMFMNKIRDELSNYVLPEEKMIFLDEVLKESIKNHRNHKDSQTCTGDQEYLDCYECHAWEAVIFYIEQEVTKLPNIITKSTSSLSSETRNQVFISYSHKDKVYLNQLKRHFAPLKDNIHFWDDSKIKPGQKWKEQIINVIDKTKIAILLISADFFNSDFIINNELPPLLKEAEKGGTTILSIILKPCLFYEYPEIAQFQTINNPDLSLIQMDEAKVELTYVELVKQVKNIMK